MSRDLQLTHENLLNSAKRCFLENGYERTNLREICARAGVTNGAFYRHFDDKESLFGALVEPVVQEVSKIYTQSVERHFELADPENLRALWSMSEDAIQDIIEYIYDHFDEFRLLLMCADGTGYVSFIDDVVRMDVADMLRLFAELKKKGAVLPELDEEAWHMLDHAYFASLAEIVLHNFSKEKALKHAHTLAEFFTAGWLRVLGI